MLKEKETVSDEFCWHLSNIGTAMEVEKNIDVDVVFLYFLKLASH